MVVFFHFISGTFSTNRRTYTHSYRNSPGRGVDNSSRAVCRVVHTDTRFLLKPLRTLINMYYVLVVLITYRYVRRGTTELACFCGRRMYALVHSLSRPANHIYSTRYKYVRRGAIFASAALSATPHCGQWALRLYEYSYSAVPVQILLVQHCTSTRRSYSQYCTGSPLLANQGTRSASARRKRK